MPESSPNDARRASRGAAERAADHAAIDRLTSELLPALIAKLGATGLGELEVREGPWKVRLRRPAGQPAKPGTSRERRPGERGGGDRTDRTDRGGDRPGRATLLHDAASIRPEGQRVATSPAVGIFQPRSDLSAGTRVRAGDRLGAVDMLGIAQEVVAPVDGVVGATLVERGNAVEYGQELLVIEFDPASTPSTNGKGG